MIAKRTGERTGCPYCAGKKVWKGFNDLATKNPDIAREADGWDPSGYVAGSNKKKWWKCHLGHQWEATINNRTNVGSGCPYCSGNKVLVGFNDLKTKFPDIAAEADGWDPALVTSGTSKKGKWLCKEGHKYSSSIKSRTIAGSGCPICANKQVQAGINDLATTHPDLAKSAHGWDPTTVTYGTTRKFGWLCDEGHSFMAAVAKRVEGTGCPYCSNSKGLIGFNDLATKFPKLAKEADGWNPSEYLPGSNKPLPWKCEKGHRWTISPNKRTGEGTGCPICSNKKLEVGVNDLLSQFPDIASEADGWDASSVLFGERDIRDWKCEKGHTWSASVSQRTRVRTGCPYCCNQLLWEGFNDLQTMFPELACEADGWDASKALAGGNQRLKWVCSKGHKWEATMTNRVRGRGCPECAEYGFNPGKQAYFYLMEKPGEQQFGITNDINERMKYHKRFGWSEVEIVGPSPGDQILQTETVLKRWLKKEIGAIEGTTENWMTSAMEVRSLAELKARSGIDTDLF